MTPAVRAKTSCFLLGCKLGAILSGMVAPLGSGLSGFIEDRRTGLRLRHRSVGRSNCQRTMP